MAKKSLQDHSRINYSVSGTLSTFEELNAGSLQRIAASIERIASFRDDLHRLQNSITDMQMEISKLRRANCAIHKRLRAIEKGDTNA